MIAFAYQMSEKLKSVNVRYSRGKSYVGKKERRRESKRKRNSTYGDKKRLKSF